MFKPVNSRLNVTEMEERILSFWQDTDVFHQSMQLREGGPEYVFYEGPPTANGKPGSHHVLARAFKDMFPRYKTMQGYHVSRRGGWDTHGLPVEIEVEKKLGFTNKQQIEDYGIDKFNALCRESAFSYIKEWEKLTDRIGYWVDFETAYITYKNEYVESVWWILKNFWDKDLLFQGFKVVPYCPRCGTPLSDHEVALGYRDVDDPSIFVRMPLVNDPETALLVWTTTPWTLPSNVAVAAHADVDYVKIERKQSDGSSEKLILAKALLERIFGEEEVTVIDEFKGKKLQNVKYQPLFTFIPTQKDAYYVVLGEHVTTEDGSGLVHTAPAYGAEDMIMANQYDLPVVMAVAADGKFLSEVTPWAGMFVKDADPLIIQDLDQRGLMFRTDKVTHSYPFCWRCNTPLLYFARPTWFIRTSSLKDRLVELNQEINWYPEHIKNGRFGNWLENNIDWALGRERYWGTPLPVWICTHCDHQECFGSREELSKVSGKDHSELDLHRPYVDQIVLECPECHQDMQRVPELIDVWFDSGAMPVCQWHYPFENEEMFKKQYPADFICEAVDQTRGWFYSLHAISTLLFDQPSFKNVICLGLILDGEGHKMSKSKGNVVDPWDVINKNGADAMRWYLYTASPPGQERRFSPDLVAEVIRNFSLTIWNTYSFFVTYANLDGWQPSDEKLEYSPLDQWLRSSIHSLTRDVTHALETYDVLGATRPIEGFVDQLSNWFLRRSRRRYWKSESDADKTAAYATLYEALCTLSKLLAPTMPFIAEEMYQNLIRPVDKNAPSSVHLATWPIFDEALIDETVNQEMNLVMKLASVGHAARNKANRKVRQPLAEAAFSVGSADERQVVKKYADILADELNVKAVSTLNAAEEAVSYSLNPLPKQLGQKYGSAFPAIRKAILALPADEAGMKLLQGESVSVEAAGERYDILPDEVEIRAESREGYAVASEGALMAALLTDLTPDLVQEGLSREFVRRVQDLRKNAGFDISDRIELLYTASEGLQQAVENFSSYIMEETLTLKLDAGDPAAMTAMVEDEFDGENVKIGIKKA
ncbi:MAG: isoleucine--tRNA ligase [Anaerolineaceae bacterium]|nr:isoleucine--tRNA ligase [Anaerolineaceae bacterium]